MPVLRLPLRISERRALLIGMDLLLVNAAIVVALWLWALRAGWVFRGQFVLSQAYWFPSLSALWFIMAAVQDFYDLKVAANLRMNVLALFRITGLVLLIYLVIYFFSPPRSLPRAVVLYHAVSLLGFVGLWRGFYIWLLGRRSFQRCAIVVGAGWAGRAIVYAIRENLPSEYQLAGFVDDDPRKRTQLVEGLTVLGGHRDLVSLVKANDVSEVIFAITGEVDGQLMQALMDCQEQGVQINPMPLLYEQITGQVPVEHIGDNWYVVLPLDHAATGGLYLLLKRALDIVVAAVGLIIFALLFPFIVVALYVDSPGPIFYSQERVGKGGRVFRVLKLRTMIPDAEKGQAAWAQKHDPRITKVGRILRKTRLDEFPQFLNVLRGEMSVVGPRPERPEFEAELAERIPFYRARHAVKPGMAGWALIHYGYGSSVGDALIKLQYDLYYIKHQSIALDLFILLKTLVAMVTFKGR